MDREEAAKEIIKRHCNDVSCTDNCLYGKENCMYSMAIEALQEPDRILKQLEELRDDPIMHCSEDYWEGHYMAAKEAIAIVRGEEE